MSHFVSDVFGVFAAIGSYPLGNFIPVALERAHGASMDLLEGSAHCWYGDGETFVLGRTGSKFAQPFVGRGKVELGLGCGTSE